MQLTRKPLTVGAAALAVWLFLICGATVMPPTRVGVLQDTTDAVLAWKAEVEQLRSTFNLRTPVSDDSSGPSVCVAILLWKREPSLYLNDLLAELLRDRNTTVVVAFVPGSPPPDLTAVSSSGRVHLVRADLAYEEVLRAREATAGRAALPATINGPHLYAIGLAELVRRSDSGCDAFMVLEDDVLPSHNWRTALSAAVQELERHDPHWRQLKLFQPMELLGWSLGEHPISHGASLLTIGLLGAAAQTAILLRVAGWRLLSKPKSRSPVLCRPPCNRWLAAQGVAAAACAITLALLVGRQALPCPAFWESCPGLRPTQEYCCTQAQVHSRRAALPLAACMAMTPAPVDDLDPRHMVDLAMGPCMVAGDMEWEASFAAPVRGLSSSPAESLAALLGGLPLPPRPAVYYSDEGRLVRHNYVLVPHLFQHVGVVNSEGKLRDAPISSASWLGRGV